MRDINRIDTILQQLSEIWKMNPDLRLGQLLLNCMSDPMLYYVEDDKLIEVVRSYYNLSQNIIDEDV